jgi:fructose-1,6-bisphosphatase/inositol monophosphatase family enzyme
MLSQDTPLLSPSVAYFRLEPLMVRNNDVSIHLAYLDHHTPIFGIIAFPFRKVMVWGMLNDGVSIRSLTTDEERPLIAPDFKRGTGIRSSSNPFTILHVAFGTLDRATTRTALPSGCLAALYAMVKAGGGLVTDLNGQPLSSIDPPPQLGLQWLRSPEFALNHKKPVM